MVGPAHVDSDSASPRRSVRWTLWCSHSPPPRGSLWRARAGGRAVATLLLSGVGVALPIAGLLYVNAQQTGRATLFGYDLLWGAGHGIWDSIRRLGGPAHTPARGVELIGLYFTRLSTHLLETPFPESASRRRGARRRETARRT